MLRRGQCNGWLLTGGATTPLQKEPQALYTHCYGHTPNLAVQESLKTNHILHDTLDTVEEMTKLIKKSPKHETGIIFLDIQKFLCTHLNMKFVHRLLTYLSSP